MKRYLSPGDKKVVRQCLKLHAVRLNLRAIDALDNEASAYARAAIMHVLEVHSTVANDYLELCGPMKTSEFSGVFDADTENFLITFTAYWLADSIPVSQEVYQTFMAYIYEQFARANENLN